MELHTKVVTAMLLQDLTEQIQHLLVLLIFLLLAQICLYFNYSHVRYLIMMSTITLMLLMKHLTFFIFS